MKYFSQLVTKVGHHNKSVEGTDQIKSKLADQMNYLNTFKVYLY